MNNDSEEKVFSINGWTVSSGTAIFSLKFHQKISAAEKQRIKILALVRATLKLERDGHLELPNAFDDKDTLSKLWGKALKNGDVFYVEKNADEFEIRVESIPAILDKHSSETSL